MNSAYSQYLLYVKISKIIQKQNVSMYKDFFKLTEVINLLKSYHLSSDFKRIIWLDLKRWSNNCIIIHLPVENNNSILDWWNLWASDLQKIETVHSLRFNRLTIKDNLYKIKFINRNFVSLSPKRLWIREKAKKPFFKKQQL